MSRAALFEAARCAVWSSVLVLVAAFTAQAQARETADLVFKNGAVYTVDAVRSWAEAVAIKNQRIIYVGTDAGLRKYISNTTKVFDLQGKMLLPGFHDSHVHLITGGMSLSRCDLSGIETAAGVLDAVRRCRSAERGKGWVTGGGWELTLFGGAGPSKGLLDRVVPDLPVYLEAADGHSAWVNSAALKLAGVRRDTPDPPRGRIERDEKTGEPSGTLRESAMRLVARMVPPPSAADYREGLRRGLELANGFGITSIQEANASEELLRAYRDYDRSGRLSARVVAAIHVDPSRGVSQMPDLMRLRRTYRSPRLRADAAKIFADGVIEAHTAALLSPYADRPGYSGTPNYSPELLTKLVTTLDGAGFQVHVHAIGDRAVRISLDAFEAARAANGYHDARHHIAHLELVDPADIGRFSRIGVIANFQALWAYADSYITDLTEPVLGPARSRWLYPIRSVVKTGAVVVGGSDWSVTSMNPLDAMQVAVTRSPLEAAGNKPWLAEERVDLQTIIAAYTINGAYLSRQEKITGSIEPGKRADLVVLDQNLFAVPVGAIHKVKVLLTMIDGKEVHRDPSFSLPGRKSTPAPPAPRRRRPRPNAGPPNTSKPTTLSRAPSRRSPKWRVKAGLRGPGGGATLNVWPPPAAVIYPAPAVREKLSLTARDHDTCDKGGDPRAGL